jgi:hypothetical protein
VRRDGRSAEATDAVVEEIMPSNTGDMWSKIAVFIEVREGALSKFARTRQFGDLVSWTGEGALSSDELAKSLLDDNSPSRVGLGFLFHGGGGHTYYLITDSQVLFATPGGDVDSLTALTSRSWLLDYDFDDESAELMRVRLLSLSIEPAKLHWFPVVSYPYLNLSVVDIERKTRLYQALVTAGYTFASAADLAEEPSAEGAEISVIGLVSNRLRSGNDARSITMSTGRVVSSRNATPFFLTNINATPGGPILERGKIVGISTSRVSARFKENFPDPVPLHLATATKASYVKALLRAHQQSSIC